jgi:hypothetical protein
LQSLAIEIPDPPLLIPELESEVIKPFRDNECKVSICDYAVILPNNPELHTIPNLNKQKYKRCCTCIEYKQAMSPPHAHFLIQQIHPDTSPLIRHHIPTHPVNTLS